MPQTLNDVYALLDASETAYKDATAQLDATNDLGIIERNASPTSFAYPCNMTTRFRLVKLCIYVLLARKNIRIQIR